LVLIGYGLVNLLYSLCLKNIPLIDVFILASCYLFRLFYGGLIINTPISKWLYLTILCGALFMGFGKRRNEIKMEKGTTRKVSTLYSYEFLDKNLYICLAMCLVFYSLWAIDFKGIEFGSLNRILLYVTIPIVYFIMMRYSYLIEKNTNSGDPIDVLLKDIILILSVLVFIIVIIVAIYFQINIKI
jgi:4-hydroxybenzoate polyprenyltransferase